MPRSRPFQPKRLDRELEKEIEGPVTSFAESCGWTARKLTWFNRRDAPDHFYVKKGRVILIEFKRPDEEPSEAQWIEINLLRAAGLEVYVIDNLEDGYDLFT